MKELMKMNNITVTFKEDLLFKAEHIGIQQGECLAIIGRNGEGKSTLMRLMTEDLLPSTGHIQWFDTQIKPLLVAQEAATFVEDKMVSTKEAQLLSQWQVPNLPYEKLSGGEKLKRRLAFGFAQSHGLLLLDEPTNHLDKDSTAFLIEQIKSYSGTVVLVSHDRYFIDAVATKIWSIESQQIIEQVGNYSHYQSVRENREKEQARAFDKQKKEIKRVSDQMNTLQSWSSEAHAQSTKQEGFKEYYRGKAKRMDTQVKSKQKRLQKEIDKADLTPITQEEAVTFTLKNQPKQGRRILELQGITKKYQQETLFEAVSFTIQQGEKIALTGANGAGKTTLLNIIMGETPTSGSVWRSPAAKIGYLTQEVFDLPLDKSPEKLFTPDNRSEIAGIRHLFKQLGFQAQQWFNPISEMSMGERVKCKLMRYIIEGTNVLVLDEPTNHLDLPSREQLEVTLAAFTGTLIVVSHDRYFIEKVTDRVLLLKDKKIGQPLEKQVTGEDNDTKRLLLENERQHILGQLSLLTPKDSGYDDLDKAFKELSQQIRNLS
ncbi:ribosomal protection-like ABC-F family protein [Brochothrix thermosphacta]|uniref:ribosomal protection-like ABC-F family protein n=1 Tax=Brochothrix thermosphacta TaxID=2756 RepID=UPI003F94AAF9